MDKKKQLEILASNVKLLALDVDGVLTDGRIIYTSEGWEVKNFNAKDGLGLAAARLLGLKLAVITGRTSEMVRQRIKELGIHHLYEGCKNKSLALEAICKEENIEPSEVAYIGDDLNDLGILQAVGLPMAPQDACREVLETALFVSSRPGGRGAVRECVELILKEQHRWEKLISFYENERYENKQ